MRIRLLQNDVIRELDLEDYIANVVTAEMPENFPWEALKAQAVAARSYACFAIEHPRHEDAGADLCASSHCQLYKEPAGIFTKAAALETKGLVLVYEDEIVEACYFSHCDGLTRSAEEIWGGRVDYLVSVTCPCGFNELLGHGVGMCQWGAKALAEAGKSFEEILKHYYTGTETAPLAEEEEFSWEWLALLVLLILIGLIKFLAWLFKLGRRLQ